ncbi:class F sortase [Prauserella sp. PE36]|uniref:Class F sortase n=1 Tax=Prauserella endophytica TaxID=1592324 RepID=A0ABY2SCR6_9PSEU|nr:MULTISPECIES: class F sortase [Prauserella]RBM19199.1 class F sortase [Prauserella sp. PE36]TKG73536.1 class F sortase [Prauserella endophytica]
MRSQFRGGRVLAAALLASLALAGCGSSGAPESAPQPTTSVPVTKPYDKLRPTQVTIPKIGADSSLISVAVTKDGAMAVPSVKEPMQAAWYRLSPVPGEIGPAIVLGHVDGNKQAGIFARLHELVPGDEIKVRRSDGEELTFAVERSIQVPKEEFPTEAVYGNTDKAQLRLITCGGVFDGEEHSYEDNVIVYANLV